MDPLPALKMYEELARIDSAAGWVVSNSAMLGTLCQIFSDEGTDEIFGQPDTIIAGGWFPPFVAVETEGGYRVSGQCQFGSGCHYATWFNGQAIIHDNGQPRIGPDGVPIAIMIAYPASDVEIVENWNTLGMRGTGSHDLRLNEVYVPEQRSYMAAPFDHPAKAFSGSLYKFKIHLAHALHATTALGVAQAALDEFIEYAKQFGPSFLLTTLADKPVIQERIARAKASLDAGRRNLYAAMEEAWEFVQQAPRIDVEHGALIGLAGCFAVEAAVSTVDLIHGMAGQASIREERPFERHYRDVHTVSQHAFASPVRFESLGKILLDRVSDWPFYYL